MLKDFKSRWDIKHNWQLLFPFLGITGLAYSAYKLALRFTNTLSIFITIGLAVICFYVLVKLTLFLFKKLEHKWIVEHRWEMIRIFIVFAITGSSSLFVGRPLMKLIGITKENLNPILYWILFIIIGLIFYQILLVFFGWVFGQGKFFWEFEKKMLKRFGLGKLIN
ncbi:hypothetical protein SAMN04515667_2189 [Formosa sp. Hel1_31_208]|uniref:DUF6787 family protein n=1 Tax=Formosa sp. Hel1_31_208 TaxID=1798225 RepID=UPI00087B72CC|nr:DUF6787 family protein [Formosa sp. Hel1_31_208]SDS44244.1 hypothetical protein SAMN04515667_2189 [Formosa sp. Hel1_31_208]